MATHHLDDTQPHAFWDNTLPPRVHIQPGDTVVFETLEASAQQIQPHSTSEVISTLDFAFIHPLTGPVYVEGAEPGDALVVEIISIKHKGWGWNAVIPNFGLLGEDFSEPYLHHYKLSETSCEFRPDIHIPYEPFCGVMGVAPREAGRFTTIPPRENAGNIDIRHLTPGSKAFFPVLVPGALFSCGDCHSAQGDGEVNGTGIETLMTVTLTLQKGANIPELRFITPPGKKLTVADEAGYFVTTAHGHDLFKVHGPRRETMDNINTHDGSIKPSAIRRERAFCALCGVATRKPTLRIC